MRRDDRDSNRDQATMITGATPPSPAPTVAGARGHGGLPTVVLTADDGARAEVYLHGGHVTSWTPAGGTEQLFVSSQSAFRAGTAIRGGIPVIFPQFGAGPLPRHGFARTSEWALVAGGRAPDGTAGAVLALGDSDTTQALWPHAFRAEVTIEVGARTLRVSLGIENRGAAEFAFTGALHTYLRVGEIGATTIEGLAGVRYRDQTAGGRELVGDEPAVAFASEVDRLYVDAPPRLVMHDASAGDSRRVELKTTGFSDAVVWNPWVDRARELADLGDEEYRQMVCVEAASAARPVVVGPGQRWEGVQRLTAG